MHTDRNELDNYITGHHGEDQRLGDEPDEEQVIEEATDDEVTPHAAIQRCIVDQIHFRRRINDDADSSDVLTYTNQLIEALSLAQWELGGYHKLKAALAVLRSAMP